MQGGISTPSGSPYIFIFTGESGEQFGYSDGFMDDGTFWYTGEGQEGDMEMVRGNLAIQDHMHKDKSILLFEYVRKAHVKFIGSATYIDHHIEQRPDRNGSMRNAIVFRLAVDVELSDDDGGATSIEAMSEKVSRKLSIEELRSLALLKANRRATKKEIEKLVSVRSKAIKDYALARAAGTCEGCANPAPFMARSGPFLEVHHIERLGDGGPDHPENVIAVCPNCHRRAHYSVDSTEYNDLLRLKARELEV